MKLKSKFKIISSLIASLVIIGTFSNNAFAKDENISFKSFDDYSLDGMISKPDNVKDVEKIVILIHGSGSHNMDADLTIVTKNNEKNLVFKDISDELVKNGFTVFRYNKRPYQIGIDYKKDPSIKNSEQVIKYNKNILKYFVSDAEQSVKFLEKKYPKAKIYLLGHSEGTFVSLQVANMNNSVKGVALIGFYSGLIDTALFEQLVYRFINKFESLDKNNDGFVVLDEIENSKDEFAQMLKPQFDFVDIDKDKKISTSEFKAGQLSNILIQPMIPKEYTLDQLSYPKVEEIIKDSKFKIMFFQGTFDNQTPVYHTESINLINNVVWKNDNLKFYYFPNLGHSLDVRDSYEDVFFRPMDKNALKKLGEEMKKNF